MGCYPGHWRMFNSICGLYPLAATLTMTIKNVSRLFQKLFPGVQSWEARVYQIKGVGLSFSSTKGSVPSPAYPHLEALDFPVPMLHTLLFITLCLRLPPLQCLSPCLFSLASFPVFSSAPPPSEIPTHINFLLPNTGGIYCPHCSLGDNRKSRPG